MEYGELLYDQHGRVTGITVGTLEPVVPVSVPHLAQLPRNPLTNDGVLVAKVDCPYRFVRLESPDVAIFERVEAP